ERDWVAAERELKQAVALNPDSTVAISYYNFYLYAQGRTKDCVAELKHGLQVDPLSLTLNTNLAEALYYARQYDQTIEACRKTLEIDPNSVYARLLLGSSYQQQFKYEAAIAEFQKIRQLENNLWAIAALGNIYGVSGQKDEARKMLAELQAQAKKRYV